MRFIRPQSSTKLLLVATLALPAQAQLKIPTWKPLSTDSTATTLRTGGANYIRSVQYVTPKPATTAAQLTAINPHLPKILPDFNLLLETAQLSSRFQQLYDTKHKKNRSGDLHTPHNYFDCETTLLLTHPTTHQKVFLLQSDMDVVTDGSDPGRSPSISNYDLARTSDWFLPETAYSWVNKSSAPNPFLNYYPEALAKLQKLRTQLEAEAKKDPGVVWREMIRACDSQIYRVKERGLHNYTKTNLKQRRFLLATEDPFVVLPVPWVKSTAAFSPRMGDYAAVIYKTKSTQRSSATLALPPKPAKPPSASPANSIQKPTAKPEPSPTSASPTSSSQNQRAPAPHPTCPSGTPKSQPSSTRSAASGTATRSTLGIEHFHIPHSENFAIS